MPAFVPQTFHMNREYIQSLRRNVSEDAFNLRLSLMYRRALYLNEIGILSNAFFKDIFLEVNHEQRIKLYLIKRGLGCEWDSLQQLQIPFNIAFFHGPFKSWGWGKWLLCGQKIFCILHHSWTFRHGLVSCVVSSSIAESMKRSVSTLGCSGEKTQLKSHLKSWMYWSPKII